MRPARACRDRGDGRGARWLGYLGARLLSSATLGAAVGALGRHALCALPVATVQLTASLLVGGFAAWQGLRLIRSRGLRPRADLVPLRVRSRGGFARGLAELLPRRGGALGTITGLLPCGALLGAYALAAATASPTRAAGLMVVFSLASAPGLLAPALLRIIPGVHAAAWSVTTRAIGWWVLALYTALRPWWGAHHH